MLAPADYELLVYNTPEDITISGDIAKVSSTGENNIEALPGYLFSATQALDVVRDDTLRTTVKMFQRIRQLTLILKLEEGDHDRITATSATLTGIAPSMNLKTGELPLTGGASLSPIFEKATSSDGLPTLVATFRLLGISMDEEQLLTVDVSLNNQTVQTIRTDLTSILHQQMTGSMAPLTLDATLSLPSEVEISAHITDWTIVENEDIDVH